MQSWLQNNAKELARVGVDPNSVAQMYQQNPSGFGEFVDHLEWLLLVRLITSMFRTRWLVVRLTESRLAETIRSNQAGEALTARGQKYHDARSGRSIDAESINERIGWE